MRKAKLGLQMVNASSAIFRIHRRSRFFSAKHMLQVLKIPVMMDRRARAGFIAASSSSVEVLGENCISP